MSEKSVVGHNVTEARGHIVERLIVHFKDLMLLSVTSETLGEFEKRSDVT